MKLFKYFILIPFIVIGIIPNVKASTDTTKISVSSVYHDVKHGIDINAPKIEQAIGTIAKDLKVTADKVWDILVKQQRVWSWCALIGEILTILSWLHFWHRLKEARIDLTNRNELKDTRLAACIITCALAITGTIVSGMFFSQMLTGFINPEYGAMKTIAEVAQELK